MFLQNSKERIEFNLLKTGSKLSTGQTKLRESSKKKLKAAVDEPGVQKPFMNGANFKGFFSNKGFTVIIFPK